MNDAAKSFDDLAKGAGRSAGEASVDDAYTRLEKDMTNVKTEIARLSDQIADAVNALGVIAQSETRRGSGAPGPMSTRWRATRPTAPAPPPVPSRSPRRTRRTRSAIRFRRDRGAPGRLDRPGDGTGFLIGVTWRR